MFDFTKAFRQAQINTDQPRQGKIAERIGIKPNDIALLLHRGRPLLSKVEHIAGDGFGMKLSEFIALGED